MGYFVGIYTVDKISKEYSLKEWLYTRIYLNWKNNKWNTTINKDTGEAPYPTFEKFLKGYEEKEYKGEPSKDEIKFYQEYLKRNNKEEKELFSFGSGVSKIIDEMITECKLKHISKHEGIYEIPKNKIKALSNWINKKYEEYEIVPAVIDKAYTYSYDEEKEEDKITSIPFDGIEMKMEDGNFRRIDNDGDDAIFICKKSCDRAEVVAIRLLKNAIDDMKNKYSENINYLECGW